MTEHKKSDDLMTNILDFISFNQSVFLKTIDGKYSITEESKIPDDCECYFIDTLDKLTKEMSENEETLVFLFDELRVMV